MCHPVRLHHSSAAVSNEVDEARRELEKAGAMTDNDRERSMLRERIAGL